MATNQEHTRRRSLRGRFLVASPHADASPYRRSVVLLLEHNEQGAAGVLLNGKFRSSLAQLRAQLPRLLTGTDRQAASLSAIPVQVAVWEAGQLDLEVASGLWLNAPVDAKRLLAGDVPDWKHFVREVGRSIYRDALGIEQFPEHVSVN